MSTTGTDRPAGWYPDPTNPRINHYWTGTEWGEPPDVEPATAYATTTAAAAAPTSAPETGGDRGLLIFGYTIGVLVPFIGWITAITIGVQDRYKRIRSHAVGIALASITAAAVYVVIGIAIAHHPSCSYGQRVADNVASSLNEAVPYPSCK